MECRGTAKPGGSMGTAILASVGVVTGAPENGTIAMRLREETADNDLELDSQRDL
jgi:hypothetical protein